MNLFASMLTQKSIWNVTDSGRQPGRVHMAIDQAALNAMIDGSVTAPQLRFFEWDAPTVTYGHLLNPEAAQEWAEKSKIENRISKINLVKRPTGGGIVLHTDSDLSFSLLWPRASKLFSERPRDCYEKIHAAVLKALNSQKLSLFSKPACASEPNRFSACFTEPVCNDIMLDNKKIVGGALRLSKAAILYQGTIQWDERYDKRSLKEALTTELTHGN